MRNATYMRRRGFTLIEVLTTVTIIGMLVALTTFVYTSSLKRSRDGQRKTDLDTIKNTLEQYYLDNRSYVVFDGSNGEISSARWQLDSRGVFGVCRKKIGLGALAPTYIANIPEDPVNKVNINAACAELTSSNLANKYLYFAGKLADTNPKAGYYLLAKMETAPQVSMLVGDCTNSNSVCFITNTLNDWGYGLSGLTLGNGISSSITQNYKVNSTPNN